MSESPFVAWQLIDSAFPTGVFAHSWGLEAAWHHGERDSGQNHHRCQTVEKF